eukprot:GGOE01049425.1.p1 GENE.GGOE01049425.1~~GGOE01049425.1.p1  ORF type:complete len:408 (-),score=134.02 GGOE01049425.1:236-1459(-)
MGRYRRPLQMVPPWLAVLALAPLLARLWLRARSSAPLKPPALSSAPAPAEGDGAEKPGKAKKRKFHGTATHKVYCTPNKTRLLEAIADHVRPGTNILCVSLDVETLDRLQELAHRGRVVHIDMDHGTPNAPKPRAEVEDRTMDAWDITEIKALGVDFQLAVLDMGQWSGRDSLLDALSLLNMYWQALPSLRLVICRSKALLQLSQRLLDASTLQAGQKRQRLFLDRPGAPEPPILLDSQHPECLRTVDKVVCAVGVVEYRATIPFVVRDGDEVLEIGCQAGLTTKLIRQANRSGRVVGSDVAAASIEHAKHQGEGSGVEWAVLDAWDLHGIRSLGDWTVMYVDVSGISGRNSVQDALALVLSYFRLLPHLRTVVVKSRCLRDLSGRLLRLEPKQPNTEARVKTAATT